MVMRKSRFFPKSLYWSIRIFDRKKFYILAFNFTIKLYFFINLIQRYSGVMELVQVRMAGLVDVRPRRCLNLKEFHCTHRTFGRGEKEEDASVTLEDDIS